MDELSEKEIVKILSDLFKDYQNTLHLSSRERREIECWLDARLRDEEEAMEILESLIQNVEGGEE